MVVQSPSGRAATFCERNPWHQKCQLPTPTPTPTVTPTTPTPTPTPTTPTPTPTPTPPPSSNIYYVDPNGNDAGSGTQSSPWRTLAKAQSTVPAGIGATIHLNPGVYDLASTFSLSCTTNLEGSGASVTTLKGSASPLIRVANCTSVDNAQSVTKMRLDGQNRTAGKYALLANNVNRLTVSEITVEGFVGPTNAGGAVDFYNISNLTFANSVVRNSANYDSSSCGGAVGFGQLRDSSVHDLTISEDRGYGVKASSGADTPDTGGGLLSNVDFYDLDVRTTVANCSQWNSLAFELWNTDARNVQIRNSVFNRTVSLTNGDDPVLASGYRYRIHHNSFQEEGGNNYAIELHINSNEVDHNYFNGGLYPIAAFPSYPKRNNFVHHNVFDNQYGPTAAMHFVGGVLNNRFENNTVVMRQSSWSAGVFSFTENAPVTSTIDIKRNIFYSTLPVGDRLGVLPGANIDTNSFWNITPRGTNATTANPGLPLTGGWPNAYTPTNSSLGAFDAGTFSVGPS